MVRDAGCHTVLTTPESAASVPCRAAGILVVGDDEAGRDRTGPPEPSCGPDNVAYAIYTSGTTGRPKGVLNTHRGLVNRLRWMQRVHRLRSDDVVLQKTPMSFDVSVWEFFWPLLAGSRLLIAEPQGHRDPAYLCDIIARRRVTTVHFVPSMLSAFLDQEGAERAGALRRVISSGEELPVSVATELMRRLPHCKLYNLYGPTEASIDVSAWECRPDTLAGRATTPIGTAIDNVQLHLVDGAGTPVTDGAPGELCISGVGLARGYLGRPGLTAASFVPNPFGPAGSRMYRTGDIARRNAEGDLEFLGRTDQQIKLRGIRIEPAEIESVLRSVPGVRDAVVVLREDVPGQPRLAAYVTSAGGFRVDPTLVRARLAEQLPAAMRPHSLTQLDALPLTSNGKLDRHALPRPERRRSRRAPA
jgi:amino acid adenylation domain-containing protein